MNVLLIDQFSELGGAQRNLLDLIPAIHDRGWRAHAALPGHGPLVERFRAEGIGVDQIPCGPYHSGAKSATDILRFPADVRRQTRILGDLLSRESFDLIYANGPRVWLAAAIASAKNTPVLLHAHTPFSQNYALRIARHSIRRAQAAVIACSHFVAAPLRKSMPPGGLHVIPSGAADFGFRKRQFGSDGKWRIGVIGRIAREKGQKEFLNAAAIVSREFPGVRFVICGKPMFSSAKYFEQVRALASGLPVEFLEWRDDVSTVLAELDLIAIPSLEEGLSRVMIEAFSAGVPAVAFPVGGIPEGIEDGVTGFLTAAITPKALANRLLELMKGSSSQLEKAAAAARRQWERFFTVENYRDRVTGVMESAVKTFRTTSGRSRPS